MKRWLKRIAIVLAIVFVLIQLVPVDRSNPLATKPLTADDATLSVLRRSCYDCHSNQTKWPWYAYVAPVSWLVAQDVHDGRHELNFSTWGDYAAGKRLSFSGQIIDEITEGKMPLPNYLRLHPDAKPTPADIAVLQKWADEID